MRGLHERLIGSIFEGTGGVRYHLRELVGEGGQGWVFKANYDDPDGFWVVVKVLRHEGQTDALKRFEREANVLRMLGAAAAPNPNIVRFYDYGVHRASIGRFELELPFLVLEYVDGPTLAHLFERQGHVGLPVTRVRRVMRQVARALHFVHQQRVVHRDLKPSNILLAHLQGQEIAKVTDFGIVKMPEIGAYRTETMAGASLGYAPPEQYEAGNNRVGVETDVFSFAAITYEALSGLEAFPSAEGESPLRVVARMLSGERPSLLRPGARLARELQGRVDLIAALDRVLAKATAPDPGDRHGSIRDLWEELEPVLREGSSRQGVPSDEPSHAELGRGAFAFMSAPPPPEWRALGRAMTGERLRSAVVSEDRTVVAIGAYGLYHFARGVWSAMRLPDGVDARFVRGLLRLRTGQLLFYGDAGFAMLVGPGGEAERLTLPEHDVTVLGAHADSRGVLLVGERRSQPGGVLLELGGVGVTSPRQTGSDPSGAPRSTTVRTRTFAAQVPGTLRLHGVARLADGSVLVAGTHGALVVVMTRPDGELSFVDVPWARSGHLYAAAATPDGGALVVGSGGHALRVTMGMTSAPPAAQLEAVQTTRDLTSIAVDAWGAAWATGGQARLVRRAPTMGPGAWIRVPLPEGAQGQLIAVLPGTETTTVLAEDGLVLEASAR